VGVRKEGASERGVHGLKRRQYERKPLAVSHKRHHAPFLPPWPTVWMVFGTLEISVPIGGWNVGLPLARFSVGGSDVRCRVLRDLAVSNIRHWKQVAKGHLAEI
jgi:hypothetical protein